MQKKEGGKRERKRKRERERKGRERETDTERETRSRSSSRYLVLPTKQTRHGIGLPFNCLFENI